MIYDRVRDLPITIEGVSLERLELSVSPDFTRVTTVVHLSGDGHDGVGEDVTYEIQDHDALHAVGLPDMRGEWTLQSLSRMLDGTDLFPAPPVREPSRDYRRWAVESAALDLGLRQAGDPLWRVLGEDPAPVEFVISIGLGDPPDIERVLAWHRAMPDLGFKLDATASWTREIAQTLADEVEVEVVDLKGLYENTPVDQGADAGLYALVAEEFPHAWIEDPRLTDATRVALAGAESRITWDAPIHSVDDITGAPVVPRTINIKPSRCGSVERLFACYDHVRAHDMGAYGGGQYELGPGRGHIQYLASLFHPDAPNDTAPVQYHRPPEPGRPTSPLTPTPSATGFRWESGV